MTELPVDAFLGRIRDSLRHNPALVLCAAPGAGKTTKVPQELLDIFPGTLLLVEPRRVAARAAAARIAANLGETVGMRAGYAVRGESRTSAATRILAVTPGVLLRRIQEDPGLEGIGAVIFDEFHERQAELDLGFTLTLDLRVALRPELGVVVMSATLDSEALARHLDGAPVISVPGRLFPVEQLWSRRAVTDVREVPQVTARAIRECCASHDGDVLAFLPGAGEIRRTHDMLLENPVPESIVAELHGSLNFREQNAALAPAPPGKRRIILATNIAESSLTIDGVTIVVDSGWEKRLRFLPGAGMSFLEYRRIARSSAAQRSGRAGRTAPGVALRLWPRETEAALPEFTVPEILECDPAPVALELAAWGSAPASLHWLTPPPEAPLQSGYALLRELDLTDGNGKLLAAGRVAAKLGIHPRLGAMMLRAQELKLLPLAAELAAILSEREEPGSFGDCADIRLRIESWRRHPERFAQQQLLLEHFLGRFHTPWHALDVADAGMLLSLAFPEWIGQRRGNSPLEYRLAGGRSGTLRRPDDPALDDFLAVARLDGNAGMPVIRLAAPITVEELKRAHGARCTERTELFFDADGGRGFARRELKFGSLVLASTPTAPPPGVIGRAALAEALRRRIQLPPAAAKEAVQLRDRINFAHRDAPERFPDWSDGVFGEVLARLADPFLEAVRSIPDLEKLPWTKILQSGLDYNTMRELDALWPERFQTPAGSRLRIDYSQQEPVLAVKLPELYGLDQPPVLGRSRVPLKLELLSPAGRPVQISSDLPAFWRGSWSLVRRDMRSQYPKHFWPEEPQHAEPASRSLKRDHKQEH